MSSKSKTRPPRPSLITEAAGLANSFASRGLAIKPRTHPGAPSPIAPSMGYVVMIRDIAPDKIGNLYIPGTEHLDEEAQEHALASMRFSTGRCVAVGPDTVTNEGTPIPARCQVGDRIMTSGYSAFAQYIDVSGIVFEVAAFEHIVGVITEE